MVRRFLACRAMHRGGRHPKSEATCLVKPMIGSSCVVDSSCPSWRMAAARFFERTRRRDREFRAAYCDRPTQHPPGGSRRSRCSSSCGSRWSNTSGQDACGGSARWRRASCGLRASSVGSCSSFWCSFRARFDGIQWIVVSRLGVLGVVWVLTRGRRSCPYRPEPPEMCLRLLLRRRANPSRISFPYGGFRPTRLRPPQDPALSAPIRSRGGSSVNLPIDPAC